MSTSLFQSVALGILALSLLVLAGQSLYANYAVSSCSSEAAGKISSIDSVSQSGSEKVIGGYEFIFKLCLNKRGVN